jgi:hypothetical protein
MGTGMPMSTSNWNVVLQKYNLNTKFDNNAISFIKSAFDKDEIYTTKTIEYTLEQKPHKPSAFIKKALADNWIQKQDIFNHKMANLRNMFNKIPKNNAAKYVQMANKAVEFLRARYSPEEFSLEIITLIYFGLCSSKTPESFLRELDGSKYQSYFHRHMELLVVIDDV